MEADAELVKQIKKFIDYKPRNIESEEQLNEVLGKVLVELKDQHDKINDLKAKVDEKNARIDMLEDAYKQQQKELGKELENKARDSDRVYNSLQGELERERKDNTRERTKLEDEIEELKNAQPKDPDELLLAEVESLKGQIANIQADSEAKDVRISLLEDTYRTDIDNLTKQIGDNSQEIQIDSLQKQLERERIESYKEINKLGDQIVDLLDRGPGDPDAALLSQINELTRVVDDQKTTIAMLQDVNRTQLENQTRELQDRDAKIQALQDEIDRRFIEIT